MYLFVSGCVVCLNRGRGDVDRTELLGVKGGGWSWLCAVVRWRRWYSLVAAGVVVSHLQWFMRKGGGDLVGNLGSGFFWY